VTSYDNALKQEL